MCWIHDWRWWYYLFSSSCHAFIVIYRPREWMRVAHQFQDGYVSPINSRMGNVGHPYETFFIREEDPRIFVKMRAWVTTDGCVTGYTGICMCAVHWVFSLFISFIHKCSVVVCLEPLRRLSCSCWLSVLIRCTCWVLDSRLLCSFIFRWPLIKFLLGGSSHALLEYFTLH